MKIVKDVWVVCKYFNELMMGMGILATGLFLPCDTLYVEFTVISFFEWGSQISWMLVMGTLCLWFMIKKKNPKGLGFRWFWLAQKAMNEKQKESQSNL